MCYLDLDYLLIDLSMNYLDPLCINTACVDKHRLDLDNLYIDSFPKPFQEPFTSPLSEHFPMLFLKQIPEPYPDR